ncbi:MAG: DNA-3-methyladenine glycosylase family protein [Pararhizobium sp.]
MRRIAAPADLEAGLAALQVADPRLASVAARAGPLPLRLREPGFSGLAAIIVSQMVSRASAEAIWRRLSETTGGVGAEACLRLTDAECRAVGLSRAKEETLKAMARAVMDGLDLTALCALPTEEAAQALTRLKGVGQWTADVYLLFCAGHPDIFPDRDVALQNAVRHAFSLPDRPAAKALAAEAALWAPWRGVAARLFWAYYAREMRRDGLPVD